MMQKVQNTLILTAVDRAFYPGDYVRAGVDRVLIALDEAADIDWSTLNLHVGSDEDHPKHLRITALADGETK